MSEIDDNREVIGRAAARLREGAGLTQQEAAALLGVDAGTLSRKERGLSTITPVDWEAMEQLYRRHAVGVAPRRTAESGYTPEDALNLGALWMVRESQLHQVRMIDAIIDGSVARALLRRGSGAFSTQEEDPVTEEEMVAAEEQLSTGAGDKGGKRRKG